MGKSAQRFPFFRNPEVDTFADYAESMETFTSLTGREELYEKNVTDVKARIDAVLAEAADWTSEEQSYLCLKINVERKRVLKDDNFACEIIGAFGLKNAVSDTSALDEPSLEAVAAADPECIFVLFEGADTVLTPIYEEAFTSQAVWSDLSAVRNGRVVFLPPDLFLYKPNARRDQAYQFVYDHLTENEGIHSLYENEGN